jgi:hypothetical protein
VIAFDHALEIVADGDTYARPAKADEIQLTRTNGCKVQAGANREFGESRVVLDTAQAFFSNRKNDFTIARDTSRGIMHL